MRKRVAQRLLCHPLPHAVVTSRWRRCRRAWVEHWRAGENLDTDGPSRSLLYSAPPCCLPGRCHRRQISHPARWGSLSVRVLGLPRPAPTPHSRHRLVHQRCHRRVLPRTYRLGHRGHPHRPDPRLPWPAHRDGHRIRDRHPGQPADRSRPEPARLHLRLDPRGRGHGRHFPPVGLRRPHPLVGPRPHPRSDHRHPRRRPRLRGLRPADRNPDRIPHLANHLRCARAVLAAVTIHAHAHALRAPWPSAPPAPPSVDCTPVARSRPFLLLAVAFTSCGFAMYAVVMGLIPLLT